PQRPPLFPYTTLFRSAENYPGRPRVGDVITGSEAAGVLHAGTARRDDGAVVSSGGRVLSVVGTGTDLNAARDAAYAVIKGIRLPDRKSTRLNSSHSQI